ncbi:LORELEI-LIKE-GPI-ANCHORED PROTEIN 1 [Striga hermonthica]|uniref:LORELEI-LIKE-GPI-ANCHORED PROTEIN 1 n=1 Tax=Striga hermonthica TaxID=68872 RepID=A0A9N7NDV9_STRHE|nr:LORELEI-LIKE-GPI-ANCHORED PROTEIN 1 [Striga hermonthica]
MRINCCLVPFVCLVSLSSAALISDGVFGSSVLGERRLLQAKKQCPVSFEFQNYTTLIDQCKGPQYPKKPCCDAFKEFACPFAEVLNDLSNDCASSMFSYINLHGRYPPGLFANECREGQQGLECPAPPPGSNRSTTNNNNAAHKTVGDLWILVLLTLLSMQFM